MHFEKIIDNLYDDQSSDESDFSLLSGKLAESLLLHNFGQKHKPRVLATLTGVVDFVNQNSVSLDFVSGLSGFGWGVNFLLRTGDYPYDENELLGELDELMKEQCFQLITKNDFEFFYGATGYILYFLERRHSLPGVCADIEEIAEQLFDEVLSALNKVENEARATIDFSISHGYSGVLAIAAQIHEVGLLKEKCESVIIAIYELIRKNTLRNNRQFIVPDGIEDGNPHFSPIRWCHGQLGITLALSKTKNIFNSSKFDSYLDELCLTLSKIKHTPDQELNTPAFCHGTFGVAHSLRRIYEKSESHCLKDSINYWYDISYKLWEKQASGKYLKENGKRLSGILNGIEGIGLMILDQKNGIKTANWDKALLC